METYDELIACLRKRVWESNVATDVEHYDGPPRPPLSVERVEEAESILGFRLPTLVRRLYLEVADGYWGPGYGLEPLFNVTPDFPRSVVGSLYRMPVLGCPTNLMFLCSFGCCFDVYIQYDESNLSVIYEDEDNGGEDGLVRWPSGYSLEKFLWAWLPDGDKGLIPFDEYRPSSPPVDVPQIPESPPIFVKPEILQLLLSVDDPTAFNEPYDFVFGYGDDAVKRVEQLVPILEAIIGSEVHICGELESATFLELGVFQDSTEPEYGDTPIGLLFSAFGNLFTAYEQWNGVKKPLTPSVVEQVIKAVSNKGFHYVDWDSLAAPYTGLHPEFQNWSWAFRYFSLHPNWRQPLKCDL